MAIFCYARVSTDGQTLNTSGVALKAAPEAKTGRCDKAPHLCFLLYPEKRILSL
jgi:hypothetical protein